MWFFMTTVFTRTPVRITFVGGGSDLCNFYRKDQKGGITISAAINQYVNVIVHNSSESNFKVVYSKREVVEHYDQIKHPAARAALQIFDVGKYVEVVSLGDVSSKGTGLGAGSSYVVGLVNALTNYKHLLRDGHPIPSVHKVNGISYKEWLARSAVHIEREVLNETGGKQDQYIASYGGIRRFDFLSNDEVRVKNIRMTTEEIAKFQNHLLLINTEINRNSGKIHRANRKNDNHKLYSKMRDMAEEYYVDLSNGKWKATGEMLASTWALKKKLGKVTTPAIDSMYERAIELGAVGGKLLGAGMGGYLLIFAEPRVQKHIITKMRLRKEQALHPTFDFVGSTTIYTNP